MRVVQTYIHASRELHLHAYESPVLAAGAASEGEARTGRRAPGAGSLEFEALTVDRQRDALTLTTRVRGTNLGYLYAELLLKDKASDVFYGPVCREYIRAERNEGSSGITRPVWGEDVAVSARLRPTLRLLTDGAELSFCCPLPEGYSSPGYRQGGLYTLAGEQEPLRALLGFSSEGVLKRAIAYPEHDRRGGARVLTPSQGDRFVPFCQVLSMSDTSDGWRVTTALADTLTLGSWPLRVVTERALPGDYLVGVVAQDLDGGFHRQYAPVRLGDQ